MKNENIKILQETKAIIKAGEYVYQQERKPLKLTPSEMSEAIVLTEEDIKNLIRKSTGLYPYESKLERWKCDFFVLNRDSFTTVVNASKDATWPSGVERGSSKVLVLNFANPVEPGGGVYRGAKAQEEDLCRKSTLLVSLESREASQYYEYHKELSSPMSSDYMILSPNVEIFRDEENKLLKDSMIVSVLSCAAPYVSRDKDKLEEIFYRRILGILHVAAKYEYKHLILGAWGCGEFENDAKMVSQLFYRAFKGIKKGEIRSATITPKFEQVYFAVHDDTKEMYNLNSFKEKFDDFYHDEVELGENILEDLLATSILAEAELVSGAEYEEYINRLFLAFPDNELLLDAVSEQGKEVHQPHNYGNEKKFYLFCRTFEISVKCDTFRVKNPCSYGESINYDVLNQALSSELMEKISGNKLTTQEFCGLISAIEYYYDEKNIHYIASFVCSNLWRIIEFNNGTTCATLVDIFYVLTRNDFIRYINDNSYHIMRKFVEVNLGKADPKVDSNVGCSSLKKVCCEWMTCCAWNDYCEC